MCCIHKYSKIHKHRTLSAQMGRQFHHFRCIWFEDECTKATLSVLTACASESKLGSLETLEHHSRGFLDTPATACELFSSTFEEQSWNVHSAVSALGARAMEFASAECSSILYFVL